MVIRGSHKTRNEQNKVVDKRKSRFILFFVAAGLRLLPCESADLCRRNSDGTVDSLKLKTKRVEVIPFCGWMAIRRHVKSSLAQRQYLR
jgi:hypothetical protein